MRNKQTKTKPKRNKEKNFLKKKLVFFVLPLFLLSFFLSFFLSRDASLLTFYACSHSNNIL